MSVGSEEFGLRQVDAAALVDNPRQARSAVALLSLVY